MKFNYKGRIVEAASRDEAVRKIAAAGESDYKGATKAVKRCIALKRALKKIKKGTQLTSLTIGDSWDDVWTDDLKVSSLEDFLDDNGNLYVVPYMTDMTVPDHADLTEDDVKALDALLGAHGGDNAYKECLKKKPDGTYSFGSMGWVQVDVIDWFPELVVPFEDSSVKKVTEYANQVNAKFAEVQQKLDAIFGKQGKATRKAESRSTYRNPIKDRDGARTRTSRAS